MGKKPVVVIASGNAASQNIKSHLLRLCQLEEKEPRLWECELFLMEEQAGRIVEIAPASEGSCYIYASTHKSGSGAKSLTAHTPGNWGGNELGGEARSLNVACAGRLMAAARELYACSGELGWQFSVEVDHHGPTLAKPLLFVEIGSGEEEWRNPLAGEIAARAVVAAAKASDAPSASVGFGGTHYCPKFTPLVLSGTPLGHIISGYSLERDGVDAEMVAQALGRCCEPVEGALLDWKGIKGDARKRLVETLDSMGVKWRKA